MSNRLYKLQYIRILRATQNYLRKSDLRKPLDPITDSKKIFNTEKMGKLTSTEQQCL